jgi:hypothetical protein
MNFSGATPLMSCDVNIRHCCISKEGRIAYAFPSSIPCHGMTMTPNGKFIIDSVSCDINPDFLIWTHQSRRNRCTIGPSPLYDKSKRFV